MVTLEDILKKLVEAWNKFEDWIATGLSGIWSFFSPIVDMLMTGLENLWDTLYARFAEVVAAVEEYKERARSWIDELADRAYGWFQDAIGFAEDLFDDAVSYAEDVYNRAVDAASSLVDISFSDIWNAVDDVRSFVEGMFDDLASLRDSFNALMDYFEKFVEDAIYKILDYLIETEEEAEEYKKGVV